jgi:uncharacterized membrane-anchored protein YhcB (DUF1043 family)
MFRSDLDAALQRADALQRELDAARAQTDHLQCQLTNALAQLTIAESADALQRQVHQLADQLASTQQLLAASENERRRLEALVPSRPRVKREYKNPGVSSDGVIGFSIFFAIITIVAAIVVR